MRDPRRIPDLTGRSDGSPSKEGIAKSKSLPRLGAGSVKFPMSMGFSDLDKSPSEFENPIRDPSLRGL